MRRLRLQLYLSIKVYRGVDVAEHFVSIGSFINFPWFRAKTLLSPIMNVSKSIQPDIDRPFAPPANSHWPNYELIFTYWYIICLYCSMNESSDNEVNFSLNWQINFRNWIVHVIMLKKQESKFISEIHRSTFNFSQL